MAFDRATVSRPDLDMFFAPRGVAVVGASRDAGKLGHGVFRNLDQNGYGGAVYPVNPKADAILGQQCYPDILAVPDPVDLAAVILPAPYVLDAVDACGRRGLRGVIVLSGGFREVGAEGAVREEELVALVRRHNMRLLGPNCVGIIDNVSGLNTTFIAGRPPPGDVAFISQSGAIGGGVVDWARAEDVGFSRFVSLGNQADVTEAEILAYLGNDSHTGVITLYLESVVDGRAFMEVARDVARRKPIVGLKVGRTDAGARAAASHTGALTGTDDVYAAAFRQCGVLRVGTIEALFDAARTFAGHTEVDGDAVVIVSNAGGPAVLAADALAEAGLCLADLGTETQIQIQAGVPASAEVSNPVDILGGADGAVYHRTLTAALADPNVDAAIAIHVPQALVAPTEVADAIVRAATQRAGPSVVACFMGGETVAAARDLLRSHGITEYPTPERAAQSLGGLAWRRQWLDRPSEPATAIADADAAAVRDWLSAASTAGQSMLAGPRAFDILRAYGIPAVETRFADTAGRAVAAAGTIGYPVVLKAVAPWLVHKTEVGGVALGLADAEAVEDAFERLTRPNLGSRAGGAHSQATPDGVLVQRMAPAGWEVLAGFIRDPQFGPVVVYGLGGIYVEALGDVSFRVAPLTRVDAREMIEETRSARLLAGVRGQAPADVDALSVILQRLGRLALDQPEIAELDINPLIATGEGAVAIDVRIGLASGAEAPRSSR